MSLWVGEVLETGLDDTVTDVIARLSFSVLPGVCRGSVSWGGAKDVALSGAAQSAAGYGVTVLGAPAISRPILLVPCGSVGDRARFGVAMASARTLSPSLDGIVQASLGGGPYTTVRLTLSSNKQRAVLVVQSVEVAGLVVAGPHARPRPRATLPRPGHPSPSTGGREGEPVEALWAKCVHLAGSGGAASHLKFRKAAVIAGAQEGVGHVTVLGLRYITRTWLGKVQSGAVGGKFRPVPAEALGAGSGSGDVRGGSGEAELPLLPLLSQAELGAAFGDIKALLEGTWEGRVAADVRAAQAVVRTWIGRRRGRARRERVAKAQQRPTEAADVNVEAPAEDGTVATDAVASLTEALE